MKTAYKDIVDETSNTRLLIDGEYVELRKIAALCERLFNMDKKTFMLIHRAHYYGNFDIDDEYGRLARAVKNFAETVKYLRLLGIDQNLNEFLKDEGISVTVEKPIELEFNKFFFARGFVQRNLKKLLRVVSNQPKELIRSFLSITHGIQATICDLADEIKDGPVPLVKERFEIEKPHFVRAVRIQADRKKAKDEAKKNKSTKKKVVTVEKSVNSMEKSISIFKNKNA